MAPIHMQGPPLSDVAFAEWFVDQIMPPIHPIPCREPTRVKCLRNAKSEGTGAFRNADGSPAPVGEGVFVPDRSTRTGAGRADALLDHRKTGIPSTNRRPDLSGFPPPGSSAPSGPAWSVQIEQSLTSDRVADRNASWGAWRDAHGANNRDPRGGNWHHSGDGATMHYVDQRIHGALSHVGDAATNQTAAF